MLVSAESHVGSKALDFQMRPYIYRRRTNGERPGPASRLHLARGQGIGPWLVQPPPPCL